MFSLIICAMALPKQVVLVPLVRIMSTIHSSDTLWAVILPTVGWPFGIFLMKQFSETIPTECWRPPGSTARGVAHLSERGVPHHQARVRRPGHLYVYRPLGRLHFCSSSCCAPLRSPIALGIATLQAEFATNYGLLMAERGAGGRCRS